MKSLKKTLVLLVVFSMILSTLVPAFAFSDADKLVEADCEEAVARMVALEIINGYAEDNTFRPDGSIKRNEMAKIICKMVGIDEGTVAESANDTSKFNDVPAGAWYAGYVNVAAGRGIINGFPDGSFRPEDPLTMNQVLTLVVNALGRGEHVSAMGTWPANYIAEAAKLGLIDDTKSTLVNGVEVTEPNRGNVAIICWNTLRAPIWDVSSTEFGGSINLSDNRNTTLLSTHFRDFVYTNDDGAKFFKEAEELVVEVAPSMDKELGSRQIVLDATDNKDFAKFKLAFNEGAPRRDYEEATWYDVVSTDTLITAYVPENVCEDLEALYGKEVAVIFGDENVVASIVVTNDAFVDNEFVDKIDVGNDKITIAGETYKYKTGTKVYVNGVAFGTGEAQIEKVLTAIGVNTTSTKSLTKAVKANVILDSKNKVDRIDLTISGAFYIDGEEIANASSANNVEAAKEAVTAAKAVITDVATAIATGSDEATKYAALKTALAKVSISLADITLDTTTEDIALGNINTAATALEALDTTPAPDYIIKQAVIEKVKSKGDVVDIYANTLFNVEDLVEAEEEPKVVKEGNEIELSEIAEGDVLTLVYAGEETQSNIRTIYVSSEKVSGEADVSTTLAVTVDGEKYFANEEATGTLNGKIEDAKTAITYKDFLKDVDGEEVELYLNILGEYVALVAETSAENGVFGVITSISEQVYEDEDNDFREYRSVKIMLPNGENAVRYKVVYDKEADVTKGTEKTLADLDELISATNRQLITFKADSDKVIKIKDITVVAAGDEGHIDGIEGKVVAIDANAIVNYDKQRLEDGDKDYSFKSAVFMNYDKNPTEKEVKVLGSGWKTLVAKNEDTKKLSATAHLVNAKFVVDEDDDVLLVYTEVSSASYSESDDVYAIVTDIDHNDSDSEIVTFETLSGETVSYEAATADLLTTANIAVADFVRYTIKDGKIESIDMILDAVELNALDSSKGKITSAMVNTTATLSDGATNAVLTEIVAGTTTKDYLVFEYKENREDKLYYTDEVTGTKLSNVDINTDKVIILDLSELAEDGTGATRIDTLAEIDGENVIAIEVDATTDEDGAEILVVIK